MRRSIVAALAAALLLAACSSETRTPGRGQPVTLQIFGDAEEIKAYQELIRAFEAKSTTDDVELVAVPSQSDHMAKLATGFSGGAPPDLFLLNFRRFGQFAAKDVLEPLGPRLEGSSLEPADFYEQAMKAFEFRGRQECLPQNISSLVVYWNRRLFRSARIPSPRADWTWDDFLRVAKALTKDTDGDGRIDVYGVGTEPNLIRFAPFVWQAGGEVVDDPDDPQEFRLLAPEAMEAAKFFIELRRVHRVSPLKEEADAEGYEERFAAGRLAMMLDSRRATPGLRAVPGLDWDVAPLPRHERAATILHSDAYCMTKASQNKDAAWRFVEFALGPEGAPIIARSGRTVPSLRSVAESEAFLAPNLRPRSAHVFLDQIPLIRRLPNIATWHEIESKADPVVEEWYYGTEPTDRLGLEIITATAGLIEKG